MSAGKGLLGAIIQESGRPLIERIEELEAQVTRLQEAFKVACQIADDQRMSKPHAKYYPNMMGEGSLFEMGLQPGDLDPIGGTK